ENLVKLSSGKPWRTLPFFIPSFVRLSLNLDNTHYNPVGSGKGPYESRCIGTRAPSLRPAADAMRLCQQHVGFGNDADELLFLEIVHHCQTFAFVASKAFQRFV